MVRPGILLAPLLAAALAATACATDAGILVEITDLDLAKQAGGDTLHLFVGTALDVRDTSLVADTGVDPIPLDGSPTHTILLRPDGGLAEIGALQLAAAVTSDRNTVPEVAFAAAAARIAFADGELRRVTLTPTSQHFMVTGPDLACVTWASDPQQPFDRAIGLRADADCDAVDNDLDCGPFDPNNRATHPMGDPAACLACPTAGEPEICDLIDQNCDGRPAPPLPCALPNGPGGCFIGVSPCPTAEGMYQPCIDADVVASRDPLVCDVLNGLPGCLTDPDPLGCAASDTHRCRVSLPAAGCLVERLVLTHAQTETCDWRIVGGITHDQWLVGFQDSGSGVPTPRSTQCTTTLVARMADPDPEPSPRTVIIAATFSDVPEALIALVTLERGGDCNGEIECDTLPFPPVASPRPQPAPASFAPASFAPASFAPTITGSIIAAPVPSP